MKLPRIPLALILLGAATLAGAQARTRYDLNEGRVHFSVPPDWAAIMEKTEGNPQLVVFRVPDPSAEGSEDMASVTVKTQALRGQATYGALVQEEFELSKQQTGYERDGAATGENVHQYFVLRGGTRYRVHDRFRENGGVWVHVRCQRPLLAATTPAWTQSFDAACQQVIGSIGGGA